VELAGELLDDSERCLVEEQVRNGVPIRMALLYLLSAGAGAGAAIGLTAA
jgi:aspartate carbamoyltransferase catalytic subunit